MNIKELKAKQGNIDVSGKIIEKGETRGFTKFGRPGRVSTAILMDDSGSIKLTLWNEQIDMVNVGDVIQIKNGWADEFRGELQISTGRNGTMEVLGKNEPSSEKPDDTEELPEEDITAKEEELED